jgi:mannan endo-1,4-beta-mannosidase
MKMLLLMMKKEIVSKLTFFLFLLILLVIQNSYAVKSFAGSNLYYAAGLSIDQQKSLFSQLQSAGVKVFRVWLDGKKLSSYVMISH